MTGSWPGDPTLVWWDHLLAVVLAVVLPAAAIVQGGRSRGAPTVLSTRDKLATYWANVANLALLAGVTVVAWRLAGRSLAELGLTAAPRRPAAGAAVALAILVLWALDTRRKLAPRRLGETRARWRRESPTMPVTPRELRHFLAVVTAAAVGEEIFHRGFLIAYLAALTGPSPAGLAAAVTVAAGITAISHWYQDRAAMARIALLAAAQGAMLVVTGSLWLPIAVHFCIDLGAMLLAPRLLGAPAAGQPAAGPAAGPSG